MSDEDDVMAALTQAMREADASFESGETGGGGTRHYLRDCFFPALERHDLRVVSASRLTVLEEALDRIAIEGHPMQAMNFRDAIRIAAAARELPEPVRGARS